MISLIIDENSSALLKTRVGGKDIVKIISWAEASNILHSYAGISSGLLPRGARYFRANGDEVIIAFDFPPSKQTLCVKHDYQTKIYKIDNVPLPGGIWILRLVKTNSSYSVGGAILAATKSPGIIDENTCLYQWPTPNVDYDGRVCWNRDHHLISNIKTVSAVYGIHKFFLVTNFNDHLWHHGSLSRNFHYDGFNVQDIEKYFQKLADCEVFDESLLVSLKPPNLKSALSVISSRKY